MLNTDYVCEETVIDKPLTVVFDALQKLQSLFHSNFSTVLNFKQLKQSPEFDVFLGICAKLQKVRLPFFFLPSSPFFPLLFLLLSPFYFPFLLCSPSFFFSTPSSLLLPSSSALSSPSLPLSFLPPFSYSALLPAPSPC